MKPVSARAVPGEKEEGLDPFLEKNGGRQPLLATVIRLLQDPAFDDAIVVQGTAGSGKSAFTRRLCVALLEEGLRPIRVRIRDLLLDRSLMEDLQQAILNDREMDLEAEEPGPRPSDLFLGGKLFEDVIRFGGARISPYVIVLDGWDEVVSTQDGFTKRIERMLEAVRSELLRRNARVRVVLTGRPSEAVAESNFLLGKTPVLTIRSYTGEQLRNYLDKLEAALKDPIVPGDLWTWGDRAHFDKVITSYEKETQSRQNGQSDEKSLEILGLPLLAHLAILVMARYTGDLEDLIRTRTTLYRRLVDLTCGKAGKAVTDPDALDEQAMWREGELRALLHQTARAITVHGAENIPRGELELRLDGNANLERSAERAEEDHPLSRLMISYYFKGGHAQLGCEFLHKSFREYLFAEGIVEILKWYGYQQKVTPPERPQDEFWKDFEENKPDDQRWEFSRRLAKALAPQWLTPEVRAHLHLLIEWEIARSFHAEEEQPLGAPTRRLNSDSWERVRDGMADIWDWWAEGVHLRPQPVREKNTFRFEQPFVAELIEWAVPQDWDRKSPLPSPPRSVTMDGHLGAALCEMTAWIHFQVGRRTTVSEHRQARRYQAVSEFGGQVRLAFSPGGRHPSVFRNFFREYQSRINAVGWLEWWSFPVGYDLRGVSFAETGGLFGLSLSGSLLTGADFSKSDLGACSFAGAALRGANFIGANLAIACLFDADLSGADFSRANLTGANLTKADLREANLDGVITLTGQQLAPALIDSATVLPTRGLRPKAKASALGRTK